MYRLMGFVILIYILFSFGSMLALILIGIKKGSRFDKMVFITRLCPDEILERMNQKNVRDIFLFEFYSNEKMQGYILETKEINKDWYYKEGKVTYDFKMRTFTEGTEISLNVIERSSPKAQLRYGYVMKEFMNKKLDASLRL